MSRMNEWTTHWNETNIPLWHKQSVHHFLTNHRNKLLFKSPSKVLVPLCGKSLDMKWLLDEGHNVVGIEGVEAPVKDYFKENNLEMVTENLSSATLYRTPDGRMKIFVCDIMDIQPALIGKFDAVWDRAALVALLPEDRPRYTSVIMSCLEDNFRYLLSTLEYEPMAEHLSHPRLVPASELKVLYGDKCDIDIVERTAISDEELLQCELKVYNCTDNAFLLTPRNINT